MIFICVVENKQVQDITVKYKHNYASFHNIWVLLKSNFI